MATPATLDSGAVSALPPPAASASPADSTIASPATTASPASVTVTPIQSGVASPQSALPNGAADVTAADYYFQSYSHFGIHEEMLKDRVRTLAYRKAILNNAHLFRGKTVLDVGCGTGILCLFAAKTGAKQVIGVECASIAVQAKQIVKDNKLDHIITIIQGKLEDVTLPVAAVDVIISEWMGYCLLYESMLDTVLYARDRFLAPSGVILPDSCSLYMTLLEDSEYRHNKLEYWQHVYGYRMSVIAQQALAEPLIDTANASQVLTAAPHCRLLTVDVMTVKREQLDFSSAFSCLMQRNDYVHAYCLYFTVDFSLGKEKVHFSTAPTAPYTHWKSTILYLARPLTACKGETVRGQISIRRNAKNPRDLDLQVDTEFDGVHDSYHGTQQYRLH